MPVRPSTRLSTCCKLPRHLPVYFCFHRLPAPALLGDRLRQPTLVRHLPGPMLQGGLTRIIAARFPPHCTTPAPLAHTTLHGLPLCPQVIPGLPLLPTTYYLLEYTPTTFYLLPPTYCLPTCCLLPGDAGAGPPEQQGLRQARLLGASVADQPRVRRPCQLWSALEDAPAAGSEGLAPTLRRPRGSEGLPPLKPARPGPLRPTRPPAAPEAPPACTWTARWTPGGEGIPGGPRGEMDPRWAP